MFANASCKLVPLAPGQLGGCLGTVIGALLLHSACSRQSRRRTLRAVSPQRALQLAAQPRSSPRVLLRRPAAPPPACWSVPSDALHASAVALLQRAPHALRRQALPSTPSMPSTPPALACAARCLRGRHSPPPPRLAARLQPSQLARPLPALPASHRRPMAHSWQACATTATLVHGGRWSVANRGFRRPSPPCAACAAGAGRCKAGGPEAGGRGAAAEQVTPAAVGRPACQPRAPAVQLPMQPSPTKCLLCEAACVLGPAGAPALCLLRVPTRSALRFHLAALTRTRPLPCTSPSRHTHSEGQACPSKAAQGAQGTLWWGHRPAPQPPPLHPSSVGLARSLCRTLHVASWPAHPGLTASVHRWTCSRARAVMWQPVLLHPERSPFFVPC